MNTYGYVGGNPLRYVDPEGKFLGVIFNPVTVTAIGLTLAIIAADHAINTSPSMESVTIGPFPGATTADKPEDAGRDAADEIKDEKTCPNDPNDPDRCTRIRRECKRKCLDKNVPGLGFGTSEYVGICTRVCTEIFGCSNIGGFD